MRLDNRPLLFVILVFLHLLACSKQPQVESDGEELASVVSELNNTVEGLFDLVRAQSFGNTVTSFQVENQEGGYASFIMVLDDGQRIRINNNIQSGGVAVPDISIGEDKGELFWLLDGAWIQGDHGEKARVSNRSERPRFVIRNGGICYVLGDSDKVHSCNSDSHKRYIPIEIEYDPDIQCVSIRLSSGVIIHSVNASLFSDIKRNVPNQAFYKDVFLDAGTGLNSGHSIPAISALGLSSEYMEFSRSANIPEELSLQKEIIVGSAVDQNGRLLYPDGQARFRLLYVIGGSATTHGKTLGEEGMNQMRTFVSNGGSYAGSCAGSFFVSNGYDDKNDYPYYLNLWPGRVRQSGLKYSNIDMAIPPESPLLQYFDFGGDNQVKSVYHSKGGYPDNVPSGTKVLAYYSSPDRETLDGKIGIWSFQEDEWAGRIVVSGSHPEYSKSGEILNLSSAMIRYALDGCGATRLKGYLHNGVPRVMNRKTEEGLPAYTCIGDLQVHHFVFSLPSGASPVTVRLEVPSNVDFRLMLNKESYAFPSASLYSVLSAHGEAVLSFDSLSEGTWYVGVQCLTTVNTGNTESVVHYSGRTDVLNGVPYSISASWNE